MYVRVRQSHSSGPNLNRFIHQLHNTISAAKITAGLH